MTTKNTFRDEKFQTFLAEMADFADGPGGPYIDGRNLGGLIGEGLSNFMGNESPTVTDLRAVTDYSRGQTAYVSSLGRGFRFDDASTATDDGTNVLTPGNITPPAPGRWISIFDAGKKDNFAASTRPLATNDASEGYSIGSEWYNSVTRKEYVCLEATTGAARWIELPSSKTFILVLYSDSETNMTIPVDTMAEALALCSSGYGFIYVGGTHNEAVVLPTNSWFFIYGSTFSRAKFNSITFGDGGVGYAYLSLFGSFEIGPITNDANINDCYLYANGVNMNDSSLDFVALNSAYVQLDLCNCRVFGGLFPGTLIPPGTSVAVISAYATDGNISLENLSIGLQSSNYIYHAIDVSITNPSTGFVTNIENVKADVYSYPRVSFDKFNSFIRVRGFANIRNVYNRSAKNSIELYGNNTAVDLFGGDLGVATLNDLLIDPAATGVKFSATGVKFDPSNLSYPAGSTVIIMGQKTNRDGIAINGSTGLTQLLEFLTDGATVATVDTNGHFSYTPVVANWTTVNPSNVHDALERIASAVQGLLGGTIP